MRQLRAVVLAAIALAPLASSQAPSVDQPTITVTVGEPPGPIRPLGPFVTLPVHVAYSFLEATPSDPEVEISLLVPSAPPWVVTTVSPSMLAIQPSTVPCGCMRTLRAEGSLLVSATHDAPAFAPAPITVRATAPQSGIHQAAEGEGTAPVSAAFFSQIEATAIPTAVRMVPGGFQDIEVTVTNLGNAETEFRFAVEGSATGIVFTPPEPVVVAARQVGGTRNSAHVNATAASDADKVPTKAEHLALRESAALASDPSLIGDATTVSFVFDVRPVANGLAPPRVGAPGVPEVAMLMVTGMVAVLMGRRRGS
jgi:hypothetical protein